MKRHHRFLSLAAALLAGLSLAGLSLAQEEAAEAAEATEQEEEVMEEIVVVVDRSGDPIDVDALRLEQLREQVIKDFTLAQEEQEKEAWRQGLQTTVSRPDSRIAWGYDAQAEAAMRRSTINDLPMDRVQPATVISVRF
jgi:Flp pilus assembly protein CpaB